MTAETTLAPCGECGMPCLPAEYHPYAACLMFKACHNSDTVRANLDAVRAQPPAPQGPALVPLTDGQAKAVLWAEHLRWMEAAGLDTEGMRPGEWLEHWLTYVRAIEAAHGITGATHGKPT
ncbi:hypothetical protein [Acidovorax sp. SUPP2539]|uniref:hypothetical protein n=1 Tax=Acidovorax sp. SUPP2539 TaxID=2920878 RepID=UPI0023DE2C2D|nr:hypothetical protein [Acidovorax sp. SUPP2539]GKS92757.1 hypothetical protein AVTE2539_25350 [Acidovorax sp. SUPP2539]